MEILEDGSSTLLVFAHRGEAHAFADVPHLITGVGKIAAAASLAQALAAGRRVAHAAAADPVLAVIGTASTDPAGGSDPSAEPAVVRASGVPAYDRVVVLGTAGLVADGPDAPTLDTVCQITSALQHDFSLPSPELPFEEELILPDVHRAVIATGDAFVQDDAHRAAIAARGASLVDMETYAYASVCRRFGAPLQVFKVPSDFADSAASGEDWDTIVHRKSAQLREFWEARVGA